MEQKNNQTSPNQNYTAPEYDKNNFHCPHCNVYAHQIWHYASRAGYSSYSIKNIKFSFCSCCNKYSIWVDEKMVYPNLPTVPPPVAEMPKNVKETYNQARSIINLSPIGACALLRLSIQLLIKELGEDETNLSKAIGNLVKKGLPERITQALDSVRVIGNNAVHSGKINIEDNSKIASSLFQLVNFITEKTIVENKQVERIFNYLPENQKQAIERRDNNNS